MTAQASELAAMTDRAGFLVEGGGLLGVSVQEIRGMNFWRL